jgi:hypothetical protein
MENFTNGLKKTGEFLHALFFTRDDDLDVLQVLFAAIIVVALMATWHSVTSTLTEEAVKVEALITLRWLAGLLVITAVPKWLVPAFGEFVNKKLDIFPSKKKEEEESEFMGRSRWER